MGNFLNSLDKSTLVYIVMLLFPLVLGAGELKKKLLEYERVNNITAPEDTLIF